MAHTPPRLSTAAREAIHRGLVGQYRSTAVPISRILRTIRTELPALPYSDEELIQQIVLDATGQGLAVHFDKAR